jgi:hypothetical protein
MSAEFSDQEKLQVVSAMIAAWWSTGLLRLYQAVSPPISHASLATDFTEANFTGYSPQTTSSWSSPALNGAFRALSSTGPYVFTQSGTTTSCDVLGWYMTDSSGFLVAAEANPSGPTTMDTTGLTYVVNLTFGATNLVEP